MHRTLPRFVTFIWLALCLALPLLSPTGAMADGWAGCRSQDPTAAVSACTSLIEARRGKPADLAEAYTLRGAARIAQKDVSAGIADLDKAISLKADHAGAYLERGRAHETLGKYQLAKQDFNQAADLFEAEELRNSQTKTNAVPVPSKPVVTAPPARAKPPTIKKKRVYKKKTVKPKPKRKVTKKKSKSKKKKQAKKKKPKKKKKTAKAKPNVRAKVNSQINCSIAGGFNC